MFRIVKPSHSSIESFLQSARSQKFSYPETGSTLGQIPLGYTADHHRARLGRGDQTFRDAVSAMREWKMFDLGWVHLFEPSTPIQVGATVAVLIHHFGFWSLNACRVVYA